MLTEEYGIPHGANVGLRTVLTAPSGSYLKQTIADEQTGYYGFSCSGLDYGWYITDAWYETATKRWQGTAEEAFYWDGDLYVQRDIEMFEVED
ncbi:MAG: hypothetical protein A2Y64_07400 [Candidatus Coatesbacteria bacterium RBG_13_66_14]|uniref:Uncharacterized protein n=1 Tax=Candidatus Coatesbacteria bacterium RBG_13_66_14 TaxID=1817816 RepID=A0A1F5F734_9BACT|nr:MAG: hypothetical protein A2Y64_07400 [Candidatus Coatesbacteria bacterium RBG_13_66_14]